MAPSRRLVAAQLTSSLGDGAFIVTSALFFTRVVGLGVAEVGAALTTAWAAGFLAGAPVGRVADRFGLRRTATVLSLGTASALALLVVVRSLPAFVAAVVLYGICQSGLGGVRQALVAVLVPAEERLPVRARLQAAGNGGLAVGATLGGIAIAVGDEWAYLAVFGLDAVAFVAAAVVLHGLPKDGGARLRTPSASVLRDRPFVVVAALNAAMLLYMPMLSVALPLWIASRTGAPEWTISVLFVLNTAGVVLGQVRVARRVHDTASASVAVGHAGVLFLLTCVAFAASGRVPGAAAVALLVLGALLQVVGEMLLASGFWAIAFALAPADRQGEYQGFFASGVAVARTVGPLLLTTLLLSGGTVGWLVLGLVFVLAAAVTPSAVRRAQGPRTDPSSRSSSAASGGQADRPRRVTA